MLGTQTFTRNQLEGRFRQGIEEELTGYFRRSMQLAVIVDEQLTPSPLSFPDHNGDSLYRSAEQAVDPGRPSMVDSLGPSTSAPLGPGYDSPVDGPFLSPRSDSPMTRCGDAIGAPGGHRINDNTFETFVSRLNRFAHARGRGGRGDPGKSYNPLTIYGASGLADALLHEMGHYIRDYFAGFAFATSRRRS